MTQTKDDHLSHIWGLLQTGEIIQDFDAFSCFGITQCPQWSEGRLKVRCGLDYLSAVADGTAQHHAEDHSNNHDPSNTDAHVADYVELTVEKVLDCHFTVRGLFCGIRAGFLYGATALQHIMVGGLYHGAIIIVVVGFDVEALDVFNNLILI